MKQILIFAIFVFSTVAGAHKGHHPVDPSMGACKQALQWCAEAFEDDYENYGYCLQDAAEETGGFVNGFGMACPEDKNYCEVAKESCLELYASGNYDSVNQCLDYRAGGDCK